MSEIASSPRASRCAFMTMRRYLVTVTPGIATGYWKAMKRPSRARSSGSASVMSSPSEQDWPSVTSKFGLPMIALASVDLPEPLGPISAWNSPERTRRSTPLEDLLVAGRDVQVLDLEVGHVSPGQVSRAKGVMAGAAKSTSSASVVRCSERTTPICTRVHSSLVAHSWPSAWCEQSTRPLAVVEEAVHRRDVALEREHDGVHRDVLGAVGEQVAAVGAARGVDDPGPLEQGGDALQVGERQRLGLGDGLERDRLAATLQAQLHEQPHPVLSLRREDHPG